MYINSGGRSVKDLICVAQRGRSYRGEPQHFEESPNPGKTNCLTTVAKDNLIMQRPRGKTKVLSIPKSRLRYPLIRGNKIIY